MASKKPIPTKNSGGSKRSLVWLMVLGIAAAAGYWAYTHTERLQQYVLPSTKEESIDTFEALILPNDLLTKQPHLLTTQGHSFGPVTLYFAPQLLLSVKYSHDSKSSKASTAVWDMIDGELVIDTNTFDHTQGFADCLASQAGADDFRILRTLTQSGGTLSKEAIIKELGGDDSAICERIENLKKRHLVIIANDVVRIHVESPLFKIEPSTLLTKPIVHRTTLYGNLLPTTFSKSDIETLVKAAFGQDLAIRNSRLVYIPTYEIQVNNPDGSVRKTYWNAISGKEMWKGKAPEDCA